MRAQVVPPQRRSLAYALDLCISGIINACTIPVAGLAVQRYGGHAAAAAAASDGDDAGAPARAVPAADNVSNARAIEDGLLLVILVSFGIKFFVRPGRLGPGPYISPFALAWLATRSNAPTVSSPATRTSVSALAVLDLLLTPNLFSCRSSLWAAHDLTPVTQTQVYSLLYWTMPRDRLLEEEEECAAPTPPLALTPTAVELRRAPSSQIGLLSAAPDSAALPPPPSTGKPSANPGGGRTMAASPFGGKDAAASHC